MDMQEKLIAIRDFVNDILTTIYDVHDCSIGSIFITDLETHTTKHISRPGVVSMSYKYGPHREILKLSPTGEVYYDNIIKSILKLISGVYLGDMTDRYYYWCYINLNNVNDKIIELRNYSDEELKLYLKLSS